MYANIICPDFFPLRKAGQMILVREAKIHHLVVSSPTATTIKKTHICFNKLRPRLDRLLHKLYHQTNRDYILLVTNCIPWQKYSSSPTLEGLECNMRLTAKIEVIVLRGANLDNGYERLEREMDMKQTFDLMYIMLGVNNVTMKMENDKVASTFDEISTLIEFMLAKFEILKCQLQEMSKK